MFGMSFNFMSILLFVCEDFGIHIHNKLVCKYKFDLIFLSDIGLIVNFSISIFYFI